MLEYVQLKYMSTNITHGLTPEEDIELQALFKKWAAAGGGAFSDATFTYLAYALPTPCIETVILRETNDVIEVLLIKRPDNDPVWPNCIHSPGGALRRADYKRDDVNPINGVFERVQRNELHNNFIDTPVFVGMRHYSTNRGPEVVHVYLAQISSDAQVPESQWVDVSKLNELPNFIKHQIVPINDAVNFYLKTRKSVHIM